MQVNLVTSPDLSVRSVEQPRATRAPDTAADEAEFSHAEALNRALEQVPEVRASKVERAKDLFTSVPYPPVEMIHRISRLLAKEWSNAVG
jgi:hypothetical protein